MQLSILHKNGSYLMSILNRYAFSILDKATSQPLTSKALHSSTLAFSLCLVSFNCLSLLSNSLFFTSSSEETLSSDLSILLASSAVALSLAYKQQKRIYHIRVYLDIIPCDMEQNKLELLILTRQQLTIFTFVYIYIGSALPCLDISV